jgi:uncharacterized protein (DUF433 family)
MSHVLSIRINDGQYAALRRLARRLNQRSPSGALLLLLEEKLREIEFPAIQFRDTALGRQPHVARTGMEVWQVVMVARDFDCDVTQTAAYLHIPAHLVSAALAYRDAYPEDIEDALAENDRMGDYDRLKRVLPALERFTVPAESNPTSEPTHIG